MDRELINGQMVVNILDSGSMEPSKVRVLIFGLITENLKEVGKIISCMEKVLTIGQMEGNMMGIILKIKKVDLEPIIGLMVEFMKGTG